METMEHSQPSLLQLLAPNTAAPLSLRDKKERDGPRISSTSSDSATSASASAKGLGILASSSSKDAVGPVSAMRGNASIHAPKQPHFLQAYRAWTTEASGEASVLDRDALLTDASTTGRATFSLVARKHSSTYALPPSAAGAGTAAHASEDSMPSASLNDGASNGATAAASAFRSAHMPQRSTTARASIFFPPVEEAEEGEQREASPPPRPPAPRPRRGTLAGSSEFLAGVAATAAAAEEEESTDALNGDLDEEERRGRVMGGNASTATLDGDLWPAEPSKQADAMGTLFSLFSSQTSSGCATPTSQGRRESARWRSTTLAPTALMCASSSAASMRASIGGAAAAATRPSMLAFKTYASQSSAHSAGSDENARRRSRVTFLPEQDSVRGADADLTHPQNHGSMHLIAVGAENANDDAVDSRLPPHPTRSSLMEALKESVTGHDDGKEETAVDVDGADAPAHREPSGVATDGESSLDVHPGLMLPHTHANPLTHDDDDVNEVGSNLSSVSMNASTSTQRQHTSLPVVSVPMEDRITSADSVHVHDERVRGSVEDSRSAAGEFISLIDNAEGHASSVPERDTTCFLASTNSCTVAMTSPPVNPTFQPASLPAFSFDDTQQEKRTTLEVPELARGGQIDGQSLDSSLTTSAKLGGGASQTSPPFLRSARVFLARAASPLVFFLSNAAYRGAAVTKTWVVRLLGPVKVALLHSFAAFSFLRSSDSRSPSSGAHVDKAASADTSSSSSTITRTNTHSDTKTVFSSLNFSETMHLSLPLSRSVSLEMSEAEPLRRMPTTTVLDTAPLPLTPRPPLSLQDTWSTGDGGSRAWFSAGSQPEPRTALRSSARIRHHSQRMEGSPSSPQLSQPSSGPRPGAGDDSFVLSARSGGTPRSPHLSFAESFAAAYEGIANSDVFNRATLLRLPRTLVSAAGGVGGSVGGSLNRMSQSVEHRASPLRWEHTAVTGESVSVPSKAALLDDAYRAQLYHAFQRPPSCCIGDITSCLATYAAMVETASNGQHVLNWKELSLLLLPEDYIDYRDLFPPYHFVTFPDFIEFVEVLSVRHRL